MNILITGGAGFIGSHTVRKFVKKYPDYKIYNLDLLTYAGNQDNLADIQNYSNYFFIRGDIRKSEFVNEIFKKYKFESIIHLAAESHVDRSIYDPYNFISTNIIGTVNLLEAFKNIWNNNFNDKFFYHISTDEVYGSIDYNDSFTELSRYNPSSPYSASKASSDHFVNAYAKTFDIPIKISNCSNNFGPFQFPEKLIPMMINNIINKKELPIYGDGQNVRDWLYVLDHVDAIDLVFHNGKNLETYNIGGSNEIKNIELVNNICNLMNSKLGHDKNTNERLIKFVKDRPGHDYRYAVDSSKIIKSIGWKPKYNFKEALSETIDWYLNNRNWLSKIKLSDNLNTKNKSLIK